jgi:hypothetical protein
MLRRTSSMTGGYLATLLTAVSVILKVLWGDHQV